jgi:hypothetical protein
LLPIFPALILVGRGLFAKYGHHSATKLNLSVQVAINGEKKSSSWNIRKLVSVAILRQSYSREEKTRAIALLLSLTACIKIL